MICRDINEHKELRRFAFFICWSTPGLNSLHDKCMKRTTKLKRVFESTGYFGPIVDLAIRGTVSHMLVCHYGEHTRSICSILKEFLLKHITDIELKTYINSLLQNEYYIMDYEHSYRHKRSNLINSQIMFLVQNPRSLVCTKYIFSV